MKIYWRINSLPAARGLSPKEKQKVWRRCFLRALRTPRALLLLVTLHVATIAPLLYVAYFTYYGPLIFFVAVVPVMITLAVVGNMIVFGACAPSIHEIISDSKATRSVNPN
jgi:hypothetical protein